MNALLIRPLILGVFAFPLLVAAHQGSEGRQEPVARYSDPGNNFFSNVPINELSTKAFRRFHRRFRDATTGEYWFKYAQGYQVSFILDRHHELAYYDPSGFFLSSVRYYDGKEVASDLGENVKRRFPDYKIDVVTEVNDGQKTSYILQIMNPDYIKVLTIIDGRIDIIKELTNGSAKIDPTEAVRW